MDMDHGTKGKFEPTPHIPLAYWLHTGCNHGDEEPCDALVIYYFPFGVMTSEQASHLALICLVTGEKPELDPTTVMLRPGNLNDATDKVLYTLKGDFRVDFASIYRQGFEACRQFWESQMCDYSGRLTSLAELENEQ